MKNDTELLRQYVEERSESAFTELVREHLNLVYSSALRETGGDGALAEDVSQAVFTDLARKGAGLLRHPSLAGWLYTAVRHRAANLRRADQHRRRREEEAQSMNELLSEDSPNAAWQRVGPALDDALHELKEADRAVVVLRFLEDRTLREVGERLGLTENAARMRADRALEKLRGLLERRGITSTASGLAAALAIGAATPAPPALAASIASTVLAGGAALGSTTLTLMNIMSLTKVQVSLISALVVAGIAAPVWQETRLQRMRSENAQLRAQQKAQSRAQEAEPAFQGKAGDEAARAELERLRQWKAQTQPELLRLRGMAGVARRANAEAEELKAQLARQTASAGAAQASGPMGDLMQKAMKQAMEQQVDGKLSRMVASLRLTPEQAQAVRDILMRQARVMSTGMQQAFSGTFDKDQLASMAKDAGNPDQQIKALLTPDQLAAYPGYEQDEAGHTARQSANFEVAQMETTLGLTPEQEDRAFAALYDVTLSQLTNGPTSPAAPASTNMADVLQSGFDRKNKALESVLTPTQLENYRQQQALQLKAANDIWAKMGINASSR
ncbi:MAG: RNA polymerase sigma factor [Limisphaerales bacterium]